MADYTIRKARRSDIDTLIAFTLGEARDAEGVALAPAEVALGVRGAFDDPRRATYWIAETSGSQAVASISTTTEWSNFHGCDYWWIQSVFIVPEHRGTGLIEQLLDHVSREAAANGAFDVRLYAHAGNERALRVYERCGFSRAPYRILRRPLGGH
jgi:GNAT superfamily N-acetyltransferase